MAGLHVYTEPTLMLFEPEIHRLMSSSHGPAEESEIPPSQFEDSPPNDPVVNWTEMKKTTCYLEKMHLKLLWEF